MKTPQKSLGQHWLNDIPTLNQIVEYADLSKDDFVLEIGPGQGDLTALLLQKAKFVTSIEVDENLIPVLDQKFSSLSNFNLVKKDILKFNFNKLPKNYKIVANIPYYLTSNLLRVLSESKNPPIMAVLLVQKEVAQRIAAKPGEMSLLSVATQMYFEVNTGVVVKAELFIPTPKVDSQIILLKRRQRPLFENRDSQQLFRIIKAGFSERRKKLRSSLSGGLNISKERADQLLSKAGINGGLRAQNLSLEDWLKLYDYLHLAL